MNKFFFSCILILCTLFPAGAQEKFEIRYRPGEKFKIVEKYDLSKRTNKGYAGYIYREIRGLCEVVPGSAPAAPTYAGTFYVLEEMKRQAKPVAKKIDQKYDVRFTIKPNGDYQVEGDAPYPVLRGFPAFPAAPVAVGEKWRAYGVRVVEPKRDGVYTRVRILSEYQYQGTGDLN
ncbi:MAG TPA: hypothetical protein ENN69_01225, partial [Spirochaetia bacterium]|nr:hypothetical protein [Spirochaetia bacterium]